MRLKRRQRIITMTMALLLILSVAVGRLRADNGTCNGANIALPFLDVAGSGFFCQIAEAYFSGLTNGTTPTTYSPGNNVTREQMAAFITRTMDQSLKRGSQRAALGQWWTSQAIKPTALTAVGNQPQAVQADGENLWVANYAGGSVTCVQASDGKVLGTWTGMIAPASLLSANGRIYVVGETSPGKLYAIDPDQPAGPATLLADVGAFARGIAYDGEHILTANSNGSITNYHVPSGNISFTYTNGLSHPYGILYDGSVFWITDLGDNKLKMMGISGQIYQVIDVGTLPGRPAFDGTNIWVPNAGSHSVTVVRAATGAVVATLTGNGLSAPGHAAFDGERILVTNFTGNSVSLWRATDLKPLGSSATGAGSNPSGACSDGLNFWITLTSADKLARF
jgi:hypothetical protein